MDFLRSARNPWGEDVLVGLGWDLFWVVVFLGALFILGHAILARRQKDAGEAPPSIDPEQARDIPEKVTRHNGSARISHWVLAISTLTLLATGFVPILGLQFPWVTIHWIAGIVLTGYLVYHTVDTIRRGTLGTMWLGREDLEKGMKQLKGFFRKEETDHPKPGKWGPENITFHHITALAGIAVIATGLLMMFRVDTWFWQANPYVLGVSDRLWGWVYVLHGLAAVGFVGLLMAHIYFAVRPDKWWISRSMFKGWITREEYLAHHDPELWPVGEEAAADRRRPAPTPEPAPAPTSDAAGD
jgi:formate dehydrogenase subunit gamma